MLRRSTIISVVMSCVLWLACSGAPPVRELPLEPAGDQASVYGSLRLTPSARGQAAFTLKMGGLSPGAIYVLCLNAQEAYSPTSETLGNLGIPGWPLGAFYPSPSGGAEGFWDFEKVHADAQGRYERHFELPLPAQDYRVKFLVKLNYDADARPVLKSQPLLLDVRPPLNLDLLTGTLAALTAIPLMFIVRGRGRRRSVTDAHDLEHSAEHAEVEPELRSSAAPESVSVQATPVPDPSHAPLTLVERARVEGVLQHHKNYAWIEIHGKRKSFRPRQALVFRILCEQDPSCDGIPQDEIIKAWEEVFQAKRASPVRVRDIFRSCEHEPGDFIVRVAGPASVYRLRLEPTPPPASVDPESESIAAGTLHDEG